METVNENIPMLLSSSDEVLDLLVLWFRFKIHSISRWNNFSVCDKRHLNSNQK